MNSYNVTHNNEKILDMSTDYWCGLSVQEQMKCAAMYQAEYAKEKNLEIEITKNGIVFRLIPPGKFWMGTKQEEIDWLNNQYWSNDQYDEEDRKFFPHFFDAEKRHQVIISNPFYMAKTQLTQSQWEAVMGNNPSKFKGDSLPVETVSWDDCKSFCDKTGLLLPTEAQWEYACRAGITTAFNIGDNINTDVVNYNGNFPYKDAPKGINRGKTVEVGTLPNKNAWGLYDMHGNVWEWCENGEDATPTSHEGKFIKGGCFEINAGSARSALVLLILSICREEIIGFRPIIM